MELIGHHMILVLQIQHNDLYVELPSTFIYSRLLTM